MHAESLREGALPLSVSCRNSRSLPEPLVVSSAKAALCIHLRCLQRPTRLTVQDDVLARNGTFMGGRGARQSNGSVGESPADVGRMLGGYDPELWLVGAALSSSTIPVCSANCVPFFVVETSGTIPARDMQGIPVHSMCYRWNGDFDSPANWTEFRVIPHRSALYGCAAGDVSSNSFRCGCHESDSRLHLAQVFLSVLTGSALAAAISLPADQVRTPNLPRAWIQCGSGGWQVWLCQREHRDVLCIRSTSLLSQKTFPD